MPRPTKPHPLHVAVLGAGPIGIEAALHLRQAGHHVTVYERGQVGEHLLRWGHVRMFTPFGSNSSTLGRATLADAHPDLPGPHELLTGHDFRNRYLLPLAQSKDLADCVQTQTEVLGVSLREGGGFHLLLRREREWLDQAEVVVDCTGVYGRPNRLGPGGLAVPGESAAREIISYHLDDILGQHRDRYAGRSVLVVGNGYSAATSISLLVQLAEQHGETYIIWLTRTSRNQPIARLPGDPLRERDRLAMHVNTLATRGDHHLEYHALAQITAIERHASAWQVVGQAAGKPFCYRVDRIIANIGYQPAWELAEQVGICGCMPPAHPAYPAHAPPAGFSPHAPPPTHAGHPAQPPPGYFLLGARGHGRRSDFLLSVGLEQIGQLVATLADWRNR